MPQRGVGEPVQDLVTVRRDVQSRGLRQGRYDVLFHQAACRPGQLVFGHGLGDRVVAAERTQVGQRGVGAVEHAQLELLERCHVRHEVRAGRSQAGRPAGNASSITHWRNGSATTGLVDDSKQGGRVGTVGVGRGRDDAVDHGAREADVPLDPGRGLLPLGRRERRAELQTRPRRTEPLSVRLSHERTDSPPAPGRRGPVAPAPAGRPCCAIPRRGRHGSPGR